MLEVLKIGAAVATPLGFLGFVAALAYFIRARQLKHKEVALEKLSPEERAHFLDENLSRYKIDAANATREEKFQLIKDEMEKRYRLAVLYTLVSAFVFIACFGLAVYAFASTQHGNPTDRATTRFQVIDALTRDRIHRPLSVIYTIEGSSEHHKWKSLSEHDRGQFKLEGEPAAINILDIKCPGYSFARKKANHQENIIDLELKQVHEDGAVRFSDVITPAEEKVQMVSDKTYRDAVKNQKIPESGKITLKCENKSKYHVTLLLYRQSEEPQKFTDRPWAVLAPNGFLGLKC